MHEWCSLCRQFRVQVDAPQPSPFLPEDHPKTTEGGPVISPLGKIWGSI